jgi:hypothetical protein
MSKADWRIREPKDCSTTEWQVQDRTSSSLTVTIKPGEMVKLAAAGSPYVIPILTGDPEIGTDIVVGIAATESTETASADGKVDVYMITPETVLAAKGTTAANIDTQAEINALVGDSVCADVATLTQTIDENEGDDPDVHGLVIIGGDPVAKELYVRVKTTALLSGYSQ